MIAANLLSARHRHQLSSTHLKQGLQGSQIEKPYSGSVVQNNHTASQFTDMNQLA